MGEYAKLKAFPSESVKIGTCEDMYYLRADQVDEVVPESGSLNPADSEVQSVIRFRFPWPQEDRVTPGAFDDPFRSLGLYNVEAPAGIDHSSVQFKSTNADGYLVSLPCPESGTMPDDVKVGRNGFPGAVKLVQQAYRGGKLVGICQCACGAAYNLPTLEDAQPILDELERKAAYLDHQHAVGPHGDDVLSGGEWYREVARRLEAGYSL